MAWHDHVDLQDDREDEEPPVMIDRPVIKHQTDKALLVVTSRGLFWVPKSIVIEHTKEVLIIPAWFEPKYFKDERA